MINYENDQSILKQNSSDTKDKTKKRVTFAKHAHDIVEDEGMFRRGKRIKFADEEEDEDATDPIVIGPNNPNPTEEDATEIQGTADNCNQGNTGDRRRRNRNRRVAREPEPTSIGASRPRRSVKKPDRLGLVQ